MFTYSCIKINCLSVCLFVFVCVCAHLWSLHVCAPGGLAISCLPLSFSTFVSEIGSLTEPEGVPAD